MVFPWIKQVRKNTSPKLNTITQKTHVQEPIVEVSAPVVEPVVEVLVPVIEPIVEVSVPDISTKASDENA